MNKRHYALIMCIRYPTYPGGIKSTYTLEHIKQIVGTLSEEDRVIARKWEDLSINLLNSNAQLLAAFKDYSLKELIILLTEYTNHRFPLPLSFLPSGEILICYILAYYLVVEDNMNLRSFNPTTGQNANISRNFFESTDQLISLVQNKTINFTNEQILLINFVIKPNKKKLLVNENMLSRSDPSRADLKAKLLVVNAGPGTGKTTVANEIAFQLRDEGVLLISYTNEAIKENYKRLKTRPDMNRCLGLKNYKKTCCITTLDSLATYILSDTTYSTRKELLLSNFNLCIRNAIMFLQSIHSFETNYTHIIVDESQDIDELRAELLFTFFYKANIKSLSILGDPRQRVRTACGVWYSSLWSNNENIFISKDMINNLEFKKIGLSISHRFINPVLLNLANDISKYRPEIHHQLVSLNTTFSNQNNEFYDTSFKVLDRSSGCLGQLNVDSIQSESTSSLMINDDYKITIWPFNIDVEHTFLLIARYIRDILIKQLKFKYSDIGIICPSLIAGKNNTSDNAMKLCTIFKSEGLPCIIKTKDHVVVNAISFMTIQSSKGKEFQVVFCLGISNYPNAPWPIPMEEGNSLVYVMNTRAKQKIIYISSSHIFIKPRSIPDSYLYYIDQTQNVQNSQLIKMETQSDNDNMKFMVSHLVKDFGFVEFFSVNQMLINTSYQETFNFDLPSKPKDLDPKYWGIMTGIGVAMALDNAYPEILSKYLSSNFILIDDFHKLIPNGMCISNGKKLYISKKKINMINEVEIQRLRHLISTVPVMELKWLDLVLITRIVDFLHCGNMLNRFEFNPDILTEHGTEDSCINQGSECQITQTTRLNNLMLTYHNIGKSLISRFGKYVGSEIKCENTHLSGSIDLLFCNDNKKIVIELKTIMNEFKSHHFYQTYLYKILYNSDQAFLLNLQNGKCCFLESDIHIDIWSYMLDAFLQIHKHYDRIKVQTLINKQTSQNTNYINKFVVDTEFIMGSNQIFDIACLNLHNLYSSIISPINIPRHLHSQALAWLNSHIGDDSENNHPQLSQNLLIYAPILDNFRDKVLKCIYTSGLTYKPVFYYYNCKVDVSWLDSYPFEYVDTTSFLSTLSKKYFNTDGLNSAVCLEDLYSIVSLPVEFLTYLHCHTALGDTLLLAELLLCYDH